MKKMNGFQALGCIMVVLLALTPTLGRAQTFSVLYNFSGPDGLGPTDSLTQGADGYFYGTTLWGGPNSANYCLPGCGTVFKISAEGTLTTLYSFCAEPNCIDGAVPSGALALGTDGNFYGVTEYGGNAQSCKSCGGTVFRITSAGALTTIYNFCSQQYCTDGDNPVGSLVEGIDGKFYGATILGGNGGGNIFKIDSSGKLTSIYDFCGQAHCADGMFPVGGLVQGTDGNLYGVTRAGGAGSDFNCDYEYGCGTVFKVTPRGTLTTLHSFCRDNGCPDGTAPAGGLLQGIDGRFYGTTYQSGINGFGPGTIFTVTSAGRFTTAYRFCSQPNCADGEWPHDKLVQATDGNFYGTTSGGGDINCNPLGDGGGCGTVFEVNSSSATLSTLHDFEYTDGYDPFAGLLQATDGNFYGTTGGGGTPVCSAGPSGCGTVFGLNMGFGPFVAFVRAAGKVGLTGGILGQGFTGTTGVMLNGVPANFKVVSDTYLTATVPAGATTGYVTVTTPTGVLTSNVPFHVIQ